MSSNESFIDEVTVCVEAGSGGNGCVAFRREKFVPRGGPSGGDGGRGGDVFIIAERNMATLYDHRMRREIQAEPGANGQSKNRTGRDGEREKIRVPMGTIVYDLDSEDGAEVLADLSSDKQQVMVARSGRGGRGNARFATPTRQTPDFAERGQPGQIRKLRLSLRLLADIGLVGFPNAGKSTLLRRISAAKPRVAAYPFTTLTPSLGVVEASDRRFVVADIPGLIEGASSGVGLGDRFLRHIERTQVLVHLLDAGSLALEQANLLERYQTVRHELSTYKPELAERSEIVVLSKTDLVAERDALADVEAELRAGGREVLRISAATGEGIPELIGLMLRSLDEARRSDETDCDQAQRSHDARPEAP
ncbi:MAG: GTPase ObgE [Myxococcota bacterium]